MRIDVKLGLLVGIVWVGLAVLSASCAFAADPVPIPAGGRWVRVDAKDKISFVLPGVAEDQERHPAVTVNCPGENKPPVFSYFTDVLLAARIHDETNFYAPAIWVQIKVGNGKIYKAVWDVSGGAEPKSLVMDKKTVQALLAGNDILVRFSDHYDESYLDEFSSGGLNIEQVGSACGTKWLPKKLLAANKKGTDKGQ